MAKLDRIPHFDERSKAFGIREVLPTPVPRRSYTWSVGVKLDQGEEGACVGFGWADEEAAKPVVVPDVTNDTGFTIYHAAQAIDRSEGRNYDDGATVLAGAKAQVQRGYLLEYRWALGPGANAAENDLALAVGYKGPAVLGTNWWTGMDDPDVHGYLHPTGTVRGGHCYLVYAYNIAKGYAVWNSWGTGHYGWIHPTDMITLLGDDGEACIPVRRAMPR